MTVDAGWRYAPVEVGLLYECARWVPDAGVFQWVDILRSTLFRWAPESDSVARRQLDLEFTTMALPLDADRSIVTSRSSVHEYSWSTDSLRTLASWTFEPDVRFNDGGTSPSGEIFLGTMSMEGRTAAGRLARFEDGALVDVVQGVGISNGVAWLTDHQACYIDSLVPRVNLIDTTGRAPMTALADLRADDEPDGLTVTPEGDILVAMWQGGRLARLRRDGTRLADIHVPSHSPTSVAVGGSDLDLLLVTTASVDLGDRASSNDGRVLLGELGAMP